MVVCPLMVVCPTGRALPNRPNEQNAHRFHVMISTPVVAGSGGGMLTVSARACRPRISVKLIRAARAGNPSPGVKSFRKFNVEGLPAAKRGFDMDDDKQLPDGDELPRISTENAGLDNILGGGIDPERIVSIRRATRFGQNHPGFGIFARRSSRRRTDSLHHAIGDRARAASGRQASWVVA
jgi:hypothetical protein